MTRPRFVGCEGAWLRRARFLGEECDGTSGGGGAGAWLVSCLAPEGARAALPVRGLRAAGRPRPRTGQVAVRAGDQHRALEAADDRAAASLRGARRTAARPPRCPARARPASQASLSSKKRMTASRIGSGRVSYSAASMPHRHIRLSRRTSRVDARVGVELGAVRRRRSASIASARRRSGPRSARSAPRRARPCRRSGSAGWPW